MTAHQKVNILMVDDQPAKLMSYEAILDELGENLIRANSGREALECLLKTDVAVLLMDVSMPELDGFELADIIRQHPRFQNTAIVFISAVHLTDVDRLKGYQRGAVDYIAVPIVPEILRAKVAVFAELHRKTRQLEMLNRELQHLSAKLIATQDEERRRVARELHEGLCQDLVVAKMMIDGMARMERSGRPKKRAAGEVSMLLDHAIRHVRDTSHLLYPPLLDEIGLHSALQWYVDAVKNGSSIETSIEVRPSPFPRLTLELETTLYRIVQEALTNVFRHSGAHKAAVSLVKQDSLVMVTVRDDGKGISENIAEVRPDCIGLGIGGMKHRVKELGGELRLENASPGTVVEVVIPMTSASVLDQDLSATAMR